MTVAMSLSVRWTPLAVRKYTDIYAVNADELPINLIFRGNSDPFDAYPIRVSPLLNRIISFARDSSCKTLAVSPWHPKRAGNPEHAMSFFSLGLSTSRSTVAHLTIYGAALVRILPACSRRALEKEWLQVRAEALQNLRSSLAQYNRLSSSAIPLVQQCLYLFQGDTEARLFDTAKLHATTLPHLFRLLTPDPTAIFLFVTAMHSNMEAAVFRSEPLVMTFDDWYPDMWHTIWLKAEAMLTGLCPQPGAKLHKGITSPYFREVLLRFRLYLAVPGIEISTTAPHRKAQEDLILLWIATKLVDDAARIWMHFLDMDRPRSSSFLATTPKKSRTEMDVGLSDSPWDAILALTTFCTIRFHAHSPSLDGTNINLRDASYILAPKFKDTLEALEANLTQESRTDNAEILLWIYFTGAIFEQKKSIYILQMLEQTTKNTGTTWYFTRKLADQARRLELARWDDARRVLETFAYGDYHLQPNPKHWWDGIFEV